MSALLAALLPSLAAFLKLTRRAAPDVAANLALISPAPPLVGAGYCSWTWTSLLPA